jgi:hypothetical protein
MSCESRLTAGVLLILMPTVVYGGASIEDKQTPRSQEPRKEYGEFARTWHGFGGGC